MSTLTNEQSRFFRDNGYLRLPDVFSSEECDELREFVLAQKAGEDEARREKGLAEVVKMYGLYQRNPKLINSVVTNSRLIDALTALLGPNVLMVLNRHNHMAVNDAHGTKSESRLHRDILQPTRGLTTAAVYLEESTIHNGCTNILPGSHNLPYVGVPQADGGGTWLDEHSVYDGLADQALPIPMPKGSILLFNGLAFHSVGENQSNQTRISMTFGFRAIDELDACPDDRRQLLVAGDHLYRGNDRD